VYRQEKKIKKAQETV